MSAMPAGSGNNDGLMEVISTSSRVGSVAGFECSSCIAAHRTGATSAQCCAAAVPGVAAPYSAGEIFVLVGVHQLLQPFMTCTCLPLCPCSCSSSSRPHHKAESAAWLPPMAPVARCPLG
jgi:hypothetical protein